MAKKLTATALANLKPDPTRRLEIPDAACPGLYLILQPSGARSWAFRYRHNGKPGKLTLGTVNDRDSASPAPVIGSHLTLGDARRLAADQRHLLALGQDPAAASRKPRIDTFPDAVEEFIRRHASTLKTADAVARSLRTDAVPHWKTRRLDAITKADLIALVERKAEDAPTQANRLLAHLRKFFNWCASRDMIATSPAMGVKPPTAEASRDRYLTDAEIAALLKAAERIGYPFGPMAVLLLLSAQRLAEVAHITMQEIDFANRVWIIQRERVKNGVEQTVPLTDQMIALLQSLPRIGEKGYLFTTTGKRPVSGFNKAKRNLDRAMAEILQPDRPPEERSMPHWQFHDLRRTAATLMARLGVPIHVVESVLNHRSSTISGVSAVYNRHLYIDEKRAALEKLGNEITRIVEAAR